MNQMPYDWVEPEVFVEHRHIAVYFVYRNDDAQDACREFKYGYSPCANDFGIDTFDIREIPGYYDQSGRDHGDFLRQAIDDGRLLRLIGDREAT